MEGQHDPRRTSRLVEGQHCRRALSHGHDRRALPATCAEIGDSTVHDRLAEDEMRNEDKAALWVSVFTVAVCLGGIAVVPLLLR